MEIKNVTLGLVKAGPADKLAEGEMLAYASVFGNTDSYGDRVMKGAFTNTLKAWKDSGNTIPFLYGHNMHDPNMNIGSVVEAVEDEKGLRVRVRFDEDEVAQKVYRLVKAGRLNELSFAFDVVKSAWIEDEDDPKAVRELQEVKLYECSAVPIGANSETGVLAIKSGTEAVLTSALLEAKAGRSLSKKNEESLRAALAAVTEAKDALETVLPKAEDPEDPEDEDTADTPNEDEDEKDGAKASAGVPSGVTPGKASGTDPSPGDGNELDALLQKVGEHFGLTPPGQTSPNPSAPGVSDTELELELLNLSE